MPVTHLTLAALIALFALGCGKDDRSAPPRNPGGDAGRDGGPEGGSGGSRQDGGTQDGGAAPGCLRSGGSGALHSLEGVYLGEPVEGLFTVATLERTTEGATTTLAFEIVGGDIDIDAGGGGEEYRVELSMTALPRDQVRIGDVLHITWIAVDDGDTSALIITRDETLLFFAAREALQSLDGDSLLPALEPYGIEIGAGDASCEFDADACNFRERALRVKRGDEAATVSETGLARAGEMTAAGRVLERLDSGSGCGAPDATLIVSGFLDRP